MVFSSCDFCTASSKVRSPLYSARLSTSSVASLMRATWSRRTAVPPRRATMMWPKSCGFFTRDNTCTTRSRAPLLSVPTGRSWFSLRTAATIWSAVMPSASMAAGSRSMLMPRRVPPTSDTEPTPRTFSSRFFRVCSAQVVSSTAEGAGPCGGIRDHRHRPDRAAGGIEAQAPAVRSLHRGTRA